MPIVFLKNNFLIEEIGRIFKYNLVSLFQIIFVKLSKLFQVLFFIQDLLDNKNKLINHMKIKNCLITID
jgi:hypothetical protein